MPLIEADSGGSIFFFFFWTNAAKSLPPNELRHVPDPKPPPTLSLSLPSQCGSVGGNTIVIPLKLLQMVKRPLMARFWYINIWYLFIFTA